MLLFQKCQHTEGFDGLYIDLSPSCAIRPRRLVQFQWLLLHVNPQSFCKDPTRPDGTRGRLVDIAILSFSTFRKNSCVFYEFILKIKSPPFWRLCAPHLRSYIWCRACSAWVSAWRGAEVGWRPAAPPPQSQPTSRCTECWRTAYITHIT